MEFAQNVDISSETALLTHSLCQANSSSSVTTSAELTGNGSSSPLPLPAPSSSSTACGGLLCDDLATLLATGAHADIDLLCPGAAPPAGGGATTTRTAITQQQCGCTGL